MSLFTTLVQHSTRSFSHRNKTRSKNRKHINWKGESKSKQRLCYLLHNTGETNLQFSSGKPTIHTHTEPPPSKTKKTNNPQHNKIQLSSTHTKRGGRVSSLYSGGKSQFIEIDSKWAQRLVGFRKDFKVAFMIIFKELKENMVLLSG